MTFSFFHAADLHLGAASEGVMAEVPAEIRQKVERSTFEAFDNLIRDAITVRPLFVLFSGDITNTADENLGARLAFRNGIRQLDQYGIRSFVIRGNHDPMSGDDPLLLPDSCHQFPTTESELQIVEIDGQPVASIYGQSYPSPRVPKNLAKAYPNADHQPGLLQIAMLHGNVIGLKSGGKGEKSPQDYAPFSVEDLDEKGYDYWALGHVHSYRPLQEGPFWAVYPGSLQGISPREQGAHGYLSVKVSDGRVKTVQFREVDVVRWAETEIDLSGLKTLSEFCALTDRVMIDLTERSGGRGVIARLSYKGETALDPTLRKADFSNYMSDLNSTYSKASPFFWIDGWSIQTRIEVDWTNLKLSNSVPGHILRLVDDEKHVDFRSSLPQKLKEATKKVGVAEAGNLDELIQRAAARAVGMLNLDANS